MQFTKPIWVISLALGVVASRKIPIYDSRAVISLQQTLALYPLAIDSKKFAALDQVFAEDVIANYSPPIGVLTGLPAVESVLQASLAPVLTQHALSTFSVIELEEESASTVSSNASQYKGDKFLTLNSGCLPYSKSFWKGSLLRSGLLHICTVP